MQGAMIALPTPRYKEIRSHRDEQNSSSAETVPKYVSPVLLRLIASNAPWELDVFSDLPYRNTNHKSPNFHHRQNPKKQQKDPVEELLSTIREYNRISEEGKNPEQQRNGEKQGESKTTDKKYTCSRECAERFAKDSKDRKQGGPCYIRESRKQGHGYTSSKEFAERFAKEFSSSSSDKGSRSSTRSYERGREKGRTCCVEKCGRNNNLPERPWSARDPKRVKEASLPERPCSARAGISFEKKGRTKRILHYELENYDMRPASAGPLLSSERAKPLWFRQASLRALQALEKNLLTRLNICVEDDNKSGSKQEQAGSNSIIKKEELGMENATGRPSTAPVTSGKENGRLTSLGFFLPRKRISRRDDPSDVQEWLEEVDFPITKKFVETNMEKRCYTAPSSIDSPRKSPNKDKLPTPLEVEEELDNFKDYVQNETGDNRENEDFPSTCSSDEEDMQELRGTTENNNKVFNDSQKSRIVKLKKSSKDALKEDVSQLFRGVHESLLVSSRLAEVVEMCCKRGNELLRARESMTVDKVPDKMRWPFKLYGGRSKHSKAHRRALRAELKWSIFSNGGKLRCLNPIYGGKKCSPRIRFMSDKFAEVQDCMDSSQDRKQLKRPSTAPAGIQRTPREGEDNQVLKSSNQSRRTEGIGPWTPTPETNDTRFRTLDSPRFVKKPFN